MLEAYEGFGFDFHNRAIPSVEQLAEQIKESLMSDIEANCNFAAVNVLDIGCGNGEYRLLFS